MTLPGSKARLPTCEWRRWKLVNRETSRAPRPEPCCTSVRQRKCLVRAGEIRMNHKELGRTGVEIPEIGLGMWQYHGGVDVLRMGLESGALFIDTAELYENEEVAGQAIKDFKKRVFVATKTHHWKYNDVLRCAEASLRRLGLDTIDQIGRAH